MTPKTVFAATEIEKTKGNVTRTSMYECVERSNMPIKSVTLKQITFSYMLRLKNVTHVQRRRRTWRISFLLQSKRDKLFTICI